MFNDAEKSSNTKVLRHKEVTKNESLTTYKDANTVRQP